MKKEPLNSNQYAVLFAMKSIVEANPRRRWVLKKEIAAEFAIDTRALQATLTALITAGNITSRTLKNKQKGYAFCGTQLGWLGLAPAKLQGNHLKNAKKQDAHNIYIKPKNFEGDKTGSEQTEKQTPPACPDKYQEAAAAYPHRLTGEKGIFEGEKAWNKLVGPADEGGEELCPDFIIAMIHRYSAMPIDRLYRKKFASFLKNKLFLDYAHAEEDEGRLIADNPHVAVANITERLIAKFAETDKALSAALDSIAFVDYNRTTERLTLSFIAKGMPHNEVMKIYALERNYKAGMSEFYGVEIKKVKFAEF